MLFRYSGTCLHILRRLEKVDIHWMLERLTSREHCARTPVATKHCLSQLKFVLLPQKITWWAITVNIYLVYIYSKSSLIWNSQEKKVKNIESIKKTNDCYINLLAFFEWISKSCSQFAKEQCRSHHSLHFATSFTMQQHTRPYILSHPKHALYFLSPSVPLQPCARDDSFFFTG